MFRSDILLKTGEKGKGKLTSLARLGIEISAFISNALVGN
jgi:hypothetical protein